MAKLSCRQEEGMDGEEGKSSKKSLKERARMEVGKMVASRARLCFRLQTAC